MILDYYNIKSTCCRSRFVYVEGNKNIQSCSCNCKRQKITFLKDSTKNLIEVVFFKCVKTYSYLEQLDCIYSGYSISCPIFGFIISNNKANLDHSRFNYEYTNASNYLIKSEVRDLKEYFQSDYLSDLWSNINKLKDNLIFQ